MNPELPEDKLDAALRSRAAMTAPAHFTPAVIRQIAAEAPCRQTSTILTEYGPRLGLTLALGGLVSTLDVDRVGVLVQAAMQAASPLVLAAVALYLTVICLSLTADEPV